MVRDMISIISTFVSCLSRKGSSLIVLLSKRMEKVPKGIQGEKSRKTQVRKTGINIRRVSKSQKGGRN